MWAIFTSKLIVHFLILKESTFVRRLLGFDWSIYEELRDLFPLIEISHRSCSPGSSTSWFSLHSASILVPFWCLSSLVISENMAVSKLPVSFGTEIWIELLRYLLHATLRTQLPSDVWATVTQKLSHQMGCDPFQSQPQWVELINNSRWTTFGKHSQSQLFA